MARALIEALAAIGKDDEETVELSIASETDLKEVCSWALGKIAEAEALEDGAKAAKAAAGIRAARFAARVERLRAALAEALGIAGMRGLVLPEATLSLMQLAPSVRVTDEEAVPEAYKRQVVTTTIDKRALGAALKAGTYVPGATLSNATATLVIRRS